MRMSNTKNLSISRRDFAWRTVIASAAASLVPANIFITADTAPLLQAQEPPDLAKLSPTGRAEVESRIQTILGQYSGRFSEEQKADLRRLCLAAQSSLGRLRAYAVENADGIALYFKPIIEHEKRLSTVTHRSPHSPNQP